MFVLEKQQEGYEKCITATAKFEPPLPGCGHYHAGAGCTRISVFTLVVAVVSSSLNQGRSCMHHHCWDHCSYCKNCHSCQHHDQEEVDPPIARGRQWNQQQKLLLSCWRKKYLKTTGLIFSNMYGKCGTSILLPACRDTNFLWIGQHQQIMKWYCIASHVHLCSYASIVNICIMYEGATKCWYLSSVKSTTTIMSHVFTAFQAQQDTHSWLLASL